MPREPRVREAPTGRSARRTPRVLATVLVGLLGLGLLGWVAPPEAVIDQIGHMQFQWLLVAVAFEIASCLSYVVIFRRFFPEPPRAVSRQVAWMAMGAGA